MSWRDFNDFQRSQLASMYVSDGDKVRLAEFSLEEWGIKINPNTLGRRIREFKQNMTSTEEIHTEKSGEDKYERRQINPNTVEIVYTGTAVHTLDDLLDTMNVDLVEWEVLSWTANVWENFRALKRQDLSFEHGRITGEMQDKGGVTIVPLHQVKARLVRRKPVAVEPVILPAQVHVDTVVETQYAPPRGRVKCSLVLPDPQFGFFRERQNGELLPFHDRSALSVALLIARQLQPDSLIWLGDILDLPDWSSKFITDPTMFQTTQPSILEAAWWLGQFSAAIPRDSEKKVIEGNHDQRFIRLLMDKLPSAFGLHAVNVSGGEISIDTKALYDFSRLLDMESMGYEYVDGYPNNSVWLNDTTEILHGNASSGKSLATVSSQVGKYNHNTIFGHIHRTEMASNIIKTPNGDETVFSVSPGCLCRTDYVVPGHKRGQTWNQGIGIVYYTKDWSQIEIIPINNGTAYYYHTMFNASKIRGEVQKGLRKLAKV